MQVKKILIGSGMVAASFSPILTVMSCAHSSLEPGIYLLIDGPDHSESDKSFNEQGYNGIQSYLNHLIEIENPSKQSAPYVSRPSGSNNKDFKQMYANVPKNSTLVATGFNQKAPLEEAKEELQNKKVIYLDGSINGVSNIASIEFKVEQAAYLGGYALAEYAASNDGYKNLKAANGSDSDNKDVVSISTFGGTPIKTVTNFMGGFEYGIKDALKMMKKDLIKYPHANNIVFQTLGPKSAHFTESFESGKGTTVATNLKNAGVDVILSVAGPQVKDAINVFNGKVIGVDSKQEDKYIDDKDRFLFSILKDLSLATVNMLEQLNGEEVGDTYLGLGKTSIGDIDNNLVGISNNTNEITNLYNEAKNDQNLVAHAKAIDPEWFLNYNDDWFENIK